MDFEYTELTNCKVGDKFKTRKDNGALFELISFTDMSFVRERVDNKKRLIDFKHHFPKVYKQTFKQ